jgi:hypothetical protein
MVIESGGLLCIQIESPEDLYQALDALESYCIEDLAGDPRQHACLLALGKAKDSLAAAGVQVKEWGATEDE